MKAKKIIVLGGVAVVSVGVALYALNLLKADKVKRQNAAPPIFDPTVNPDVNPNLPKVQVNTATGYRDVQVKPVVVDTMHLPNFWQYEGGLYA